MSVPSAWRGFLSEDPLPTDPRAAASIAVGRLLQLSGAAASEFCERLSLAVGSPIRPAMLAVWMDPSGPVPPAHWLCAMARIVGPAAGPVLAELAW